MNNREVDSDSLIRPVRMGFDWYAATVEDKPHRVIDQIVRDFELADVEPCAPKNGYQSAYRIVRGQSVLANVMYGGASQGTGVHVFASSDAAIAFSGVVRKRWADHQVTRLDVAADFDRGWSYLYELAVSISQAYKLKTSLVGDYLEGVGGRTIYIGSPSSSSRMRVYEKGKQVYRGMSGGNLDWVRAEVMLRPQREGRLAAARFTPMQAFSCSKWLRAFSWQAVGDTDFSSKVGSFYLPSDDDRAYQYMLKQYGPLIKRIADSIGWAAAFERIKADLTEPAGAGRATSEHDTRARARESQFPEQ